MAAAQNLRFLALLQQADSVYFILHTRFALFCSFSPRQPTAQGEAERKTSLKADSPSNPVGAVLFRVLAKYT